MVEKEDNNDEGPICLLFLQLSPINLKITNSILCDRFRYTLGQNRHYFVDADFTPLTEQ